MPSSACATSEIAHFTIDYTFWMNLGLLGVAGWMIWSWRPYERLDAEEGGDEASGGWSPKRLVALTVAAVLLGGLAVFAVTVLC